MGQRAFTLTELVIVVTITAILSAVAIPHFATANARYKADLAARQILADLNMARAQAKSTSTTQSLVFNVPAGSYSLTSVASLDGRSPNYTLNLAADPYDCTLVSANFNGNQQVTFDAYGSADNGGQVTIQCGTIQTTVTLEQTSGKATVP